MIKHLRTYFTSPAPGRCDQHGYPETKAYRSFPGLFLWHSLFQLIFQPYVFYLRINACRNFTGAGFVVIGNRERNKMIKVPIILIIGDNENGLLPYFRILRKYIQYFRYIPGAIPGTTGMIEKVLRAGHPGYRRPLSFLHIFA